MKRSGRLIVIVILAVAAVLIAKQLANRRPERPPAVAAHPPQPETPSPQPTEPDQPPATTPPQSPAEESPELAAPPPQQREPKPAGLPEPPSTQRPPTEPEPEPASKPEPKAEKPLPGSKLSECLESGRPTMADFGAGWCHACKQMEPVLEQAAARYAGKANVVYVDTDEYGRTARQYEIRLIPTQIFFDSDGKEVFRNTGVFPIEKIDEQFAQLGVRQ